MAESDIGVSLGLDAKQLFNELQQVQAHFAQFAAKATSEGEKASHGFASGFKSGLGSLSTNLVQGIAALGIGSKINDLVEYGAKIEDLGNKYGVPTTALQQFGNAAEKNGSSLEAVAKGFRFLEVNQAKALGGNEGMVKAFRELGITFNELQSLRPEEIMQKIGSSSLNAADVVKVLGKSALELRPTLAGIADGSIRFSGAISEINIKKLKEADDTFKQLHQTITIVGGSLTGTFVRNFQTSIGELVLNSQAGLEEVKGVFSAIGVVAKAEFNAIAAYFDGVGKAITEALHGHFGAAGEKIKEGIKQGTEEATNGLSEAKKEITTHHQLASDLHKEANEFGKNFDEEKKQNRRDFGEAPSGESATGEFDDQGRPITKAEKRGEEKEVREEEKKEAKDQDRSEKEARSKLASEAKANQKLNKLDRDFSKNPAGLSLHDYATKGSGEFGAKARQAESEEGLAKQLQLQGNSGLAKEHQSRAEQLKQDIGLPSKEDQKNQIKAGLDESQVLKDIRDNTDGLGANA